MDRKIKVITDSTTSLNKKECEEYGVACLETTYMLDGELHYAFDDEETSLQDFYKKLETVKKCSTGCVNPDAFETCFEEYAKEGYEIIYIGLSSALSSTFSNSEIAANNINEKYGKKVVTCIDSRSGSYGTLILLDKIIELVNENKSPEEIKNIIDEDVRKSFVAFVPPDISFIYRSGRLSALEAGIGKLLKIVPIVYPTKEDGKLKTGDKGIGMKLALKKLKAKVASHIKENNHTRCYISTCDMGKEAEDLRQFIIENTGIKPENVKVGFIDKTMSCCCGPRTVALFSI